MKLATAFAVAAVVAFGTTAVIAQQDPIAARKAQMKETGQAMGAIAKMAKGEEPFVLATAKKSLATFQESAAKMPALFPANSTSGGETTAAPKIWESMDDFKAKFVKFGENAKSAEASVKDLDTLKAAVGMMGKDCGGCHETYRVKKS